MNKILLVHFILIIVVHGIHNSIQVENENSKAQYQLERNVGSDIWTREKKLKCFFSEKIRCFFSEKIGCFFSEKIGCFFSPTPSTTYGRQTFGVMSLQTILLVAFIVSSIGIKQDKYWIYLQLIFYTFNFLSLVNGLRVGSYEYESSMDQYGYSITKASNGDYLISGRSVVSYNKYFCLFMRISSSFFVLKSLNFGATNQNEGFGIASSTSGKTIIVGRSYFTDVGFSQYFLLLNSNDDIILYKAYPDLSEGFFYGVKYLSNENFIIVGSVKDSSYNYGNIVIVKSNGDTISQVQSSYVGEYLSIYSLSDGNYIISGTGEIFSYPNSGWLEKYSSSLSSIWHQSFTPSSIFYSVMEDFSSNILICGGLFDSGSKFGVILTSSSGTTLWTNKYNEYQSECHSVATLTDGNYAGIGNYYSTTTCALIVKLTPAGALLVQLNFCGGEETYLRGLVIEGDGGYTAIGYGYTTSPLCQVSLKVGYFLCNPGYYSLSSVCTECPIGTYSDELGATDCLNCPEGYYQDTVGQSSCKSCPSDYSPNLSKTSCLYKGMFASESVFTSSSFKTDCFDSALNIITPYTEACRNSYRSLCCIGSNILSATGPICNSGLEILSTSSLYDKYCSACTFIDQTQCPAQGVCWDDTLYTSNSYNPYSSFSKECLLAIKPYCVEKLKANQNDGECYMFKSDCGLATISSVFYGSSHSTFTIVSNQILNDEVISNSIFSNDMSNSVVSKKSAKEIEVDVSGMSAPPTSFQFKSNALKTICDISFSEMLIHSITMPTVTFETLSIASSSPVDTCTNLIITSTLTKPYSWNVKYAWNVQYTSTTTPADLALFVSTSSGETLSLNKDYLLADQTLQVSCTITNPFSQTLTSNVLSFTIINPVNFAYPCSPCQFNDRTKCLNYDSVCWDSYDTYSTTYPLLSTENCLSVIAPECYLIWSQNGISDTQCLNFVPYLDFAKMSTKPSVVSSSYVIEGVLKLRITFDVEVKTSLLSTCNDIFDELTIQSLGNDAQCSWSSDKVLEVIHSAKGTLITSYTLKEKAIYFNFKYAFNPADSVTQTVTQSDLSATTSIESAYTVPCGKPLVLTAVTQINGTFEYTYTWTLSYPPGSASSTIQSNFNSIANENKKIITVATENLLPENNLEISLSVQIPLLGVTISVTKSILIVQQLPEVSFASTELYILNLIGNQTNDLGLTVKDSPDGSYESSNTEITFLIYSGTELKTLTTQETQIETTLSSKYKLDKILQANINSGFQYNNFYNLTVCANFIGSLLQSCRTKILAIYKPPISVVIQGLTTLVSISNSLTLNGEKTEIPFDTGENVNYKWQCISCFSLVTNSECNCPSLSESEAASKVYSLAANILLASCKYNYRLTVSSQSGAFMRVSSVEGMFVTYSGTYSQINGVVINGKRNDLYLTSTLSYQGKDSDLSFEWFPIEVSGLQAGQSISYSKLNTVIYDFFQNKNIELNPLCKSQDQEIPDEIRPKEITSNKARILGIQKSSLISQGYYKYALFIKEPSDISFAIVSIQAPKFPSERSFQVTPITGNALTTSFIFTFPLNSGESDPEEVVKIFVSKCDGPEKLIYSTIGSATLFEGVLSAGGSECNHQVIVILRVALEDEFIEKKVTITVVPNSTPTTTAIASLLSIAQKSSSYINALSIISSATQTFVSEDSQLAKTNIEDTYNTLCQMDEVIGGVSSQFDSAFKLQFYNSTLLIFENMFEHNSATNLNSTLQEIIEDKIFNYILSWKESPDSIDLIPSAIQALSASVSLRKKRGGLQSYSTIRNTLEHIRKIVMRDLLPGGPSYEITTQNIALKMLKQYANDFDIPHEVTNTVYLGSSSSSLNPQEQAQTKVELPAGLIDKVYKNLPNVPSLTTTFVVGTSMTSLKFNPYENIKTNSFIDLDSLGKLSYNSKVIEPSIIALIYKDLALHSLDNIVDLYRQDTDLIQLIFNGSSIEKDSTMNEYENELIIGKLDTGSSVKFYHPYKNPEKSLDNSLVIPEYKESNYWTNKDCSLIQIDGINLITESKNIGSDKGSTSGNAIDITIDVIPDVDNVLTLGKYKTLYYEENSSFLSAKKIALFSACSAVLIGIIISSFSVFIFDKKVINTQKIKTLKNIIGEKNLPPANGAIVELIRFYNSIKRQGIQSLSAERNAEVNPIDVHSADRIIGSVDTTNGYSSLNEEEKQKLKDILAQYHEKKPSLTKEELLVILDSELQNCAPLHRRATEYIEDTMLGYTGFTLLLLQHQIPSAFCMVDLRITRPIKMFVLSIILLGELAVSGLFYIAKESVDIPESTASMASKSALYSILSLAILIPATIIIRTLLSGLYLHKAMTREEVVSKENCAIVMEKIGFVLGWITLALEILAIVMFSAYFSDAAFNIWMLTYAFTFVIDNCLFYLLRMFMLFLYAKLLSIIMGMRCLSGCGGQILCKPLQLIAGLLS